MLNACPTAIDFDVYQPRNPKASAYHRCVEDHFEQLETVWDKRYQRRFRFIRAEKAMSYPSKWISSLA